MAMSRGQMKQQVSKPPSKEPKNLVYYKNGGKASAESKGSKICPAGKAWAKRTLIHIPLLMRTWLHLSIAKTQTMRRVVRGRRNDSN